MKKIISIVLAACLVCSLTPAFGAEAHASGGMRIANTKAMPTNDSLKEDKGFVMEFLDEAYEEYVKDKSFYCADVWKEIQDSYNRSQKMIESAKTPQELFTTDGIFVNLSPKIEEEINLMARLGSLIKHYAKSKSDLKVMKRDLGKEIKTYKSLLNRKDFNDFYWGKIQNLIYEANKALKEIKTFRDYMILAEEIYSKLAQAVSATVPDWFEEIKFSFGEDEESILIPLIPEEDEEGWILVEAEGEPIYNKDQVEMARLEVIDRLNIYVDKQLDMVGSKANKDKLKKNIQKFKTVTLDKIEDVDAIYRAGDKQLAALIKKTGVSCPDMTMDDFLKVAKEYNALTSGYSQYNYSAAKWTLVESYFQTAKSIIQSATKKYEVYGVIAELKKNLKTVPKAKKEFNDLKKSTTKKLKSYTKKKNKKKYSQGKVKTVIKKGVAAMNKVEKYDVEELQLTAESYIAKADRCIKKFLVKTKQRGKGSITKSTKVKYGKKFVVNITPKAGYKIKSVKIDGKKKKLKNKYVFKKVTKRHTVRVVFGK